MTLDEAIKHAEEVAEQNEWFEKNYLESIQCKECAEEHRQLAEWLKDYKRLLEQEQKWIPVSERLPEEYADVICCTDADAKEVFIASYLGKLDDGSECFDDNEGMMWEGDVIAWMPLPKPYEPQESEE